MVSNSSRTSRRLPDDLLSLGRWGGTTRLSFQIALGEERSRGRPSAQPPFTLQIVLQVRVSTPLRYVLTDDAIESTPAPAPTPSLATVRPTSIGSQCPQDCIQPTLQKREGTEQAMTRYSKSACTSVEGLTLTQGLCHSQSHCARPSEYLRLISRGGPPGYAHIHQGRLSSSHTARVPSSCPLPFPEGGS